MVDSVTQRTILRAQTCLEAAISRTTRIMDFTREHICYFGRDLCREFDLKQNLIIVRHLSSRSLLELAYERPHEIRIGERFYRGYVSRGAITGKALHVVIPQRSGHMSDKRIRHAFFCRSRPEFIDEHRRLPWPWMHVPYAIVKWLQRHFYGCSLY